MRTLRQITISAPLIVIGLLAGACQNMNSAENAATGKTNPSPAAKSVMIDLPPNSLFSLIGSEYKGTDEAKTAQNTFYSEALPLAAEYGFTRHASLKVTAVNAGDFKPKGFIMTSWPDEAAFTQFQSDPKWPEYKAIRPEIWHDIRYYRDVQEDGLKLELRSDKYYTLAIAYLNSENPRDYQTYLSSLEGNVAANGGKFVLKLKSPKLESLTGEPSPDQLTFIEWNDPEGVDRLLGSAAYKANSHYARSGTTKFAFYRLEAAL